MWVDLLKQRLKAKRKLYNFYKNILKDFSELKLIKEPKDCKSNYWLQTIMLNSKFFKYKNKILRLFNQNNFQSRPIWQLLSDMEHFKKCPRMKITASKKMYDQIINLPSNPKL